MRLTKAALGHSGSLCLGLVSFPCHLLLCFVLCHLSLSVSPSLAVVEPVNARVRFLVVRVSRSLCRRRFKCHPQVSQFSQFSPFTLPTHSVRLKVFLKTMHPRPRLQQRQKCIVRLVGALPPSPSLSLFLFLYLCLALSWGLLLIKCVVRTTSGAHCSFWPSFARGSIDSDATYAIHAARAVCRVAENWRLKL